MITATKTDVGMEIGREDMIPIGPRRGPETMSKQRKTLSDNATIRLKLFDGVTAETLKDEYKVSDWKIKTNTKALRDAGALDRKPFYSTNAAAAVLMVSDRRVRAMCAEGRLGQRVGKRSYVISRDELVDFAKLDRPIGKAGQQTLAGTYDPDPEPKPTKRKVNSKCGRI